jgi:hypothetical protein
MRVTEFDELFDQEGSAATSAAEASGAVSGSSILPAEVAARLSASEYKNLSDGSDGTVTQAIARAVVYMSAIMGRFGFALDLANQAQREATLLYAIYELHLVHGSEKSGAGYRLKAKELLAAKYGGVPEATAQSEAGPVGAVTVPARKGRVAW